MAHSAPGKHYRIGYDSVFIPLRQVCKKRGYQSCSFNDWIRSVDLDFYRLVR